tara:strand:+ start:337 stop:531 length:195 start_codon:yes stop_codon:yes gene_type:complete
MSHKRKLILLTPNQELKRSSEDAVIYDQIKQAEIQKHKSNSVLFEKIKEKYPEEVAMMLLEIAN